MSRISRETLGRTLYIVITRIISLEEDIVMQWQDYAKIMEDVIELKGSPVSVTYTDKECDGSQKKASPAMLSSKRVMVKPLS